MLAAHDAMASQMLDAMGSDMTMMARRDDGQAMTAPLRGPADARAVLLRRGAALEVLTVSYNALEGLVAIAAGIAAGSVALTGFGIDSVIEVTSGALLWWRLRAELGLAPLGPTVERRAARGAGFLLLALGLYIVTDSVRVLATGNHPESSPIGIGLTVVSLIVMPLLARGKLRVAASLG